MRANARVLRAVIGSRVTEGRECHASAVERGADFPKSSR